MSQPDALDIDVDGIARDLNKARARKRLAVLGAMLASFAALVAFMVFSYANP